MKYHQYRLLIEELEEKLKLKKSIPDNINFLKENQV